jgi:hypothetical protein
MTPQKRERDNEPDKGAEDSPEHKRPKKTTLVHDLVFYRDDGDCVVQVENCLFKVFTAKPMGLDAIIMCQSRSINIISSRVRNLSFKRYSKRGLRRTQSRLSLIAIHLPNFAHFFHWRTKSELPPHFIRSVHLRWLARSALARDFTPLQIYQPSLTLGYSRTHTASIHTKDFP